MSISAAIHLPTQTSVQLGLVQRNLAAPVASAETNPVVPTSVLLASVEGNLTDQAAQVYAVLRAGSTIPASYSPGYVLPVNEFGFSRLFSTLAAIAVEHVYPAPIFSFQA
jgi:hypothetical protein